MYIAVYYDKAYLFYKCTCGEDACDDSFWGCIGTSIL